MPRAQPQAAFENCGQLTNLNGFSALTILKYIGKVRTRRALPSRALAWKKCPPAGSVAALRAANYSAVLRTALGIFSSMSVICTNDSAFTASPPHCVAKSASTPA